MIQSDYALSYNVKNQAIDILNRISTFNDLEHLDRFIDWFNRIIENRGRVMMADICDKTGTDPIDAFVWVGFNSPIKDANIHALTKLDGTMFYKIIFPVLKDFTQIGARR